jgi:predicted Zn-ribbon and HTH transcriptional regulator
VPRETVEEADETPRQRIVRWLEDREVDFEELRRGLELPVKVLEAELRHVERSLRRQERRLETRSPCCRDCGFDFPGRMRRHLHVPGRCPRCRSHRIDPPRFRVVPR